MNYLRVTRPVWAIELGDIIRIGCHMYEVESIESSEEMRNVAFELLLQSSDLLHIMATDYNAYISLPKDLMIDIFIKES